MARPARRGRRSICSAVAVWCVCSVLAGCARLGDLEEDAAAPPPPPAAPFTPVTPPLPPGAVAGLPLPAPASTAPAGPSASAAAAAELARVVALLVDPAAPFEAKAPYVEGAESLREAYAAYAAGGAQAAAGMEVRIGNVEVDGDAGRFELGLVAPDGAAGPSFSGAAARRDGGWQVSRASVCALLAAAQAVCPPPE